MKIKVLITVFFIFVVMFSLAKGSEEEKRVLHARQRYCFVEEFIIKYSEENLVKVISFLKNPGLKVEEIKKIPRLFAYFEIMDRLAATDDDFRTYSFEYMLENKFNWEKLGEKQIDTLTFLLIHSSGYFGEIMADFYIIGFVSNRPRFLKYFSKRDDWKKVVDQLHFATWIAASTDELSDDGFEGEFKKYIFATRDKNGKVIM